MTQTFCEDALPADTKTFGSGHISRLPDGVPFHDHAALFSVDFSRRIDYLNYGSRLFVKNVVGWVVEVSLLWPPAGVCMPGYISVPMTI